MFILRDLGNAVALTVHSPNKITYTVHTGRDKMADQQSPSSTRRRYTGSCHCGKTKYLVYLTLPFTPPDIDRPEVPQPRGDQVVYKCNCTTCHKTGMLHLRVPNAPEDFALLSPTDPLKELSDYTCFQGQVHWLFCPTCGVRCFCFGGKGETAETEIDGKKVTVWRPSKEDGWVEGKNGSYLLINALSLDPLQEGLDLREWAENKKIMYLQVLDLEKFAKTYDKPYLGGTY